jgi:hypothetical protein
MRSALLAVVEVNKVDNGKREDENGNGKNGPKLFGGDALNDVPLNYGRMNILQRLQLMKVVPEVFSILLRGEFKDYVIELLLNRFEITAISDLKVGESQGYAAHKRKDWEGALCRPDGKSRNQRCCGFPYSA